jgi:hypothetical protein
MSTAQYLLRFDDICPTMNWALWAEIESLLVQRRLKPILAVVPDNRDPALQLDSPVGDFWDRVRRWQDRGWTIALHGYQHRYVSPNAGIAATRKKSEFAGLPREQQREKLRLGMQIFEREGITSRVWIAPGNTFDATTVTLLPEFGIRIISAGYFQFPFMCPVGMTWVPQQMHYYRPAPAGVWTVCYHHNQWDASGLGKFRRELDRYADSIVSLGDVLSALPLSPSHRLTVSPWLCTHPRISKFLIRAELKLWSWWSALRQHRSSAAKKITEVQVCPQQLQ